MNFQIEMEKIIASLNGKSPNLLLHSCCSVCSSHVLSVLTASFNVTVSYYNPNIHPKSEYETRLKDVRRYLKQAYNNKVKLIEQNYNPNKFFEAVKGLENEPEGQKRCEQCFKLRLMHTAKYAKQNNYDFFTTTLTVSPHKNAAVINEIGKLAQNKHSVQFLPSDFKKKEGYKHSVQLANNYNLYRQNYCGCIFSIRE